MKKLTALLTALLLVVTLAACGTAAPDAAPAAPSETAPAAPAQPDAAPAQPADSGVQKVKIGFSMPTLSDTSWVVLRDYLIKEAKEYDEAHDDVEIELTVVVADNDATAQSSQILDLISAGQDVIFCAPVDSTAIWTSITDCHKAGIPIFAINRAFSPGAPDPEDGTFGWKVEQGAYDVVKYTIEKMLKNGYTAEEIKMLHIFGDLRDENALLFREGAERAMAEYNIKAVAEVDSEWNEETLLTRLAPVLQAHPDINLIFCPSDGLINAASAVFEREGKWVPFGDPNHIYVCDTGSFAKGLQFLRDGYIDMCGICPYGSLCEAAIEAAVKVAQGGKAESMYVTADYCTPETYEEFKEKGLLWGLEYE